MSTGFYEQIKADLGYLHLDAAAASFALLAEEARVNDWSHVEFLARLVAEQATADRNRRLAARLRYARFPYRRTLADFDFEFQPSVDRKLVEDLATLRFIEENRPILFLGQCWRSAKVAFCDQRKSRSRGRVRPERATLAAAAFGGVGRGGGEGLVLA